MRTDLWVVVPAYQEQDRIDGVLRALAAQRDRDFTLLVADNGSTDGTVATVRAFAARAPFPVEVLVEPEKGVGSAVDTAFRHAIAHGATLLARTDADCLPEPGWTAAARAACWTAEGSSAAGSPPAATNTGRPGARCSCSWSPSAPSSAGSGRPTTAGTAT